MTCIVVLNWFLRMGCALCFELLFGRFVLRFVV